MIYLTNYQLKQQEFNQLHNHNGMSNHQLNFATHGKNMEFFFVFFDVFVAIFTKHFMEVQEKVNVKKYQNNV